MPTIPAILNAIHDAVGVRIRSFPPRRNESTRRCQKKRINSRGP